MLNSSDSRNISEIKKQRLRVSCSDGAKFFTFVEPNMDIETLKTHISSEYERMYPDRQRVQVKSIQDSDGYVVPELYESSITVQEVFENGDVVCALLCIQQSHLHQFTATHSPIFGISGNNETAFVTPRTETNLGRVDSTKRKREYSITTEETRSQIIQKGTLDDEEEEDDEEPDAKKQKIEKSEISKTKTYNDIIEDDEVEIIEETRTEVTQPQPTQLYLGQEITGTEEEEVQTGGDEKRKSKKGKKEKKKKKKDEEPKPKQNQETKQNEEPKQNEETKQNESSDSESLSILKNWLRENYKGRKFDSTHRSTFWRLFNGLEDRDKQKAKDFITQLQKDYKKK